MKTPVFNSVRMIALLVALISSSMSNSYSQLTTWALPFKPNSTSNSVVVNDMEVDASGNIFATGSFKGTVNFNFNGTPSNATSVGGYDIFIARYNSSGALQWLKTIGGTVDDTPVALDVVGTAVGIAGTFSSANVDFDPGGGTNILSSSGLTDLFVMKFVTDGTYQWAVRAGGTPGELMTDIAFDSNSNVYLAGSFTTLMDFFGNTNTSSNGARDAFLCKLDATGAYQWVKVIGGAGTDVSNKITVLGSTIYVASDIGSGSPTFDFGSGTATGTFSGTGTNGILSAFLNTGVYQGNYHFTGNTHLVKMISTGSVHTIVGTFIGSMDVDPGAGTVNVTAVGAQDMFVVRVSAPIGGTYNTHVIANGISGGQVFVNDLTYKTGANATIFGLYVTGYGKGQINFGGTAAFDTDGPTPGTNDYSYLVKYNFDLGNSIFYQMSYAAENAISALNTSISRGNAVAIENSGNVIVGGYYSSTFTPPAPAIFNPGGLTGGTGSFADPGFSTAAMGYLQYINGCTIPNTVAASNDYSKCAGQTTTLTASGATTYSWNTGATTASISVAPTVTTTYTVTGTVAGGCFKTDTVKITVTALPNTVASSNDHSKCAGQTTTLTAAGATTYSWNTGSTAVNVSVAPTVSTTYTLTGTTAGCSKTDTVRIIVTPLPNIVAISNDYSKCAGQATTLIAGGGTSYSWSTGATSATISVAPTVTSTYTLTGTTSGCSKTDTVRIVVTPLPNVTGVSNDYSTCSSQTVTLTASGGTTYSWSTGATAASITSAPTVTTTYSVTGTSSGCSKTDTVRIIVTPIPNVVGISNDYSTCVGQVATLTASGGTTYSWSTGSTASGITASPTTTITYSVTGTTSGCSKSDTVRITVNTVTVSVTPISASLCTGSGASAVFTASGASTYQWVGGPATASFTVSPTTTTTYTVTGTSAQGCTKTATAVVNVSSGAVLNVTPSSPTICTGGSGTTLTASGANTYTWTSGPQTSTYAVNPSVTTTYTVSGTATGGCTGSKTVTVTVENTPTVTATASNTTICEGSSALLTGSGGNTYAWSTGSVYDTSTVAPPTTTTYTVTGTSPGGCTDMATITVNVESIPTVAISASNSTICNGSSVLLSGFGANTYVWNTGSTAASINVSPTATSTYSVTGSTNGCSNTDLVTVTVTAIPNVTGTSNDYSICLGESATLTASGATEYSWNTGATDVSISDTPVTTTTYSVTGTTDGCSKTDTVKITVNTVAINVTPISASICTGSGGSAVFTASGGATYLWNGGPPTASFTVTPTTTTTYTVTGTSAEGCNQDVSATVNVSLTAVLQVTPSSPMICTGGPGTTLTASGANTYTWTSGPNTDTYAVNPSTTTTYTVSGTATGGCTGDTTFTLTVENTPTVTATASSSTICAGSGTLLTGLGADTYAWSSGALTDTSTVAPSISSTYTVTGTTTAGCSANTTISITVNQMPDISVTANDPLLTANETGATYQWLDCNTSYSPISGEVNQGYTATQNGSYAVLVTKNGCADTSACHTIAALGANEMARENQVVVYPNPFSSTLSMLLSGPNAANYTSISVYFIDGRLIETIEGLTPVTVLETAHWNAGTYIVAIKNAHGEFTHVRVVKF